MTRKFVAIVTAIVLMGVGMLAYVWYTHDGSLASLVPSSPDTTGDSSIDETSGPAVITAPVGEVQGNRFTSAKLGFSFELPAGYKAGGYQDNAAVQTIIVQPASGDAKQSFQIFINPFDENIVLDKARIQSDLPGTEVSNAYAISLDNKAKGIMFTSNNSAFGGKSFEIWFVYQGNLYQISSYTEFSEKLKQIIGTWKFSK